MKKAFLDIARSRLIVLVYIFLFFLLSIVSFFVITDSKKIGRDYDEIIDNSIHRIRLMRENRLGVEQIQSITIDHVFHSGSFPDSTASNLKTALQKNDLNLQEFKKLTKNKNEDTLLKRTEIAWQAYKSSRDIFSVISGKTDEKKAVSYYKSEEKPAYDSFYKTTNALSALIYDNIKLKDAEIDEFSFNSEVKINILISFTIILLITLGILVARSVKKLNKQQKDLIQKDKLLLESEQLYKGLFYKSPLPKWVCDRRTMQLYEVNDAALKLYGYSREEFLNLSVFDVRPQEDHEKLKRFIQNEDFSLQSNGIRKHIKKDGGIIQVEIALNQTRYKGKDAILVVINDVTEKLKAEEKLRRKEEFFRSITENSSDIQFITDRLGEITYASPSIFNIFGFEKTDVVGKKSNDFWHPDDTRINREKFIELVSTPDKSIQLEIRCLDKNKNYRWCEAKISNQLHNPAINGYVSNYSDITERKLAEEKIKLSENLYRSLFNKSPFPIFLIDKDTLQYLEVNETAVELYGYSREEFLNLTVFNIRAKEDHGYLQEVIDKGAPTVFKNKNVQHFKKNGERITVDVAIDTINLNGKEAHLVIAHDLTKTLELQQQLNDEKLNKQVEITRAMISGQEKERHELGKELHDNVNQILATAKLYLETALSNGAAHNEFVETGRSLVNNSINEIRKISKALVPPSLGNLTLRESLKELFAPIKLAKLNIKLTTKGLDEPKLSADLKISVYRIVQEQLTNIMKYAEASEILVGISQTDQEFLLKVTDNGKGFEPSKKRDGIGFSNIINRAATFNGIVEIDSTPGNGCRLNVNFKLNGHNQNNFEIPFNNGTILPGEDIHSKN
jgi:PAS domain S-box-containing protein